MNTHQSSQPISLSFRLNDKNLRKRYLNQIFPLCPRVKPSFFFLRHLIVVARLAGPALMGCRGRPARLGEDRSDLAILENFNRTHFIKTRIYSNMYIVWCIECICLSIVNNYNILDMKVCPRKLTKITHYRRGRHSAISGYLCLLSICIHSYSLSISQSTT